MSENTPNVISLPESPDGPMPCGSPDGPMIGPSGQGPAPANRSASPVSGAAPPTNGTSGRTGNPLSPSAVLQLSLESRLHQRMDVNGSLEYALTWKRWDMLLGQQICALRARARRTSDNGYGGAGWPSLMTGSLATETYNEAGNTDSSRRTVALVGWSAASARDWKSNEATDEFHAKRMEMARGKTLNEVVGWASPNAIPATRGGLQTNPEKALGRRQQGHQLNLDDQVTLAGWTTPQTHDSQGTGSAARLERHGTTHGCKNLQDEAHLAGWPTPRANKRGVPDSHGTRQDPIVGWGTPSATERSGQGPDNVSLMQQARLAPGPPTSSFPASTENRAVRPALNPAFSLWLMGYPPEHLSCAPQATRSSRRSARRSSKRS